MWRTSPSIVDYTFPEGFFDDDPRDRNFRITEVDLPDEVVSDGDRADLKVFWEG